MDLVSSKPHGISITKIISLRWLAYYCCLFSEPYKTNHFTALLHMLVIVHMFIIKYIFWIPWGIPEDSGTLQHLLVFQSISHHLAVVCSNLKQKKKTLYFFHNFVSRVKKWYHHIFLRNNQKSINYFILLASSEW